MTFELPISEGKPVDIVDFEINLLSSPPVIIENIIKSPDHFVSTPTGKLKVDYKNTGIDEGRLNIYIYRFKTGKYFLHIFGRIRGEDFHTEKEIITSSSSNNLNVQTGRIKYVLICSRNILRKYYLTCNLKNFKDHLLSFLLPA